MILVVVVVVFSYRKILDYSISDDVYLSITYCQNRSMKTEEVEDIEKR